MAMTSNIGIIIILICSLYTCRGECPCGNVSLCNPVKDIPEKEVFLFVHQMEPSGWKMFDWSKITTISVANQNLTYIAQLVCISHQHNVRVTPLVGWDYAMDQLANSTARQTWVEKYTAFIETNHMDGVNIDLESPIYSAQTAIRDGYTQLVLEIKLALMKSNPNTQVTIDVLGAPNLYPRLYDYVALSLICDFFFVMDYDEGGSNPVTANSNYYGNIAGYKKYIDIGIPANKLVMGVPWYGYGWQCASVKGEYCYRQSDLSTARRPGLTAKSPQEFSLSSNLHFHPINAAQSHCIGDIEQMLRTGSLERKWNTDTQTPYFFFKDTANQVHQMQYDDVESLTLKTASALILNLRGVGVWIMDCLDYSNTSQAALLRQKMFDTLPIY